MSTYSTSCGEFKAEIIYIPLCILIFIGGNGFVFIQLYIIYIMGLYIDKLYFWDLFLDLFFE